VIVEISDPRDPVLADYVALTDVALRRRIEPEMGLFMAESAWVIERALDAGYTPRSLLLAHRWLEPLSYLLERLDEAVPVFTGPDELLRAVTGFHVHRGAIGAMCRLPLPGPEEVLRGARRVAILEDIVDHTNVGAIFRCAAGLGVDAVLVTPRCSDPLYRRSVRVSMGAVFQVPWTRLEPWPGGMELLRGQDFQVAAMALTADAVPLDSFSRHLPDKLALMLGTEGDGLTAHALELADVAVRIPMSGGVDSLNVAGAAAVAFWATRKSEQ
jgi:tRNA G18 (ribose-2'-O)-methylase SpoU